jgi:hypothetical protein
MSAFISGLLFADTGQLQTLNGAAGVPAGASFLLGGWAADPATGKAYVQDLAAAAVPAGSLFIDGGAFHPDGRRYVTTDAEAATDAFLDGLDYRPDGALRVNTTAPGATDTFNGGWAIRQQGAARISVPG